MNKESLYYMTLGGCCVLHFLVSVTLLFIAAFPAETMFAGIDVTTWVWTVVLAVVLLFTAWSCWRV